MSITPEQKKEVLAYKIGAMLSQHEPQLLNAIIKNNGKNEFVKTMAIARDHLEFYQGIPRKDFTIEYKNGFHNAKALSDYQPKLLARLLENKTLHKGYIKGLADGKEYNDIVKLALKIQNEPKKVPGYQKPVFLKGYNQGYRLSEDYPALIESTIHQQQRWNAYTEGLKAGSEQYKKDLKESLEKNKGSRLFLPDHQLSQDKFDKIKSSVDFLEARTEHIPGMIDAPEDMQEIADENPKIENSEKSDLLISYLPSWLKDVPMEKDENFPSMDREKDKDDYEPDK